MAEPAPALDFDVGGALKAGYTEHEIASYLGGQSGFDVEGARKAGYNSTEIIQHLAPPAPPHAAKEEVAPQPVSGTALGMAKAAGQTVLETVPKMEVGVGAMMKSAGQGEAVESRRDIDLMHRLDAGEEFGTLMKSAPNDLARLALAQYRRATPEEKATMRQDAINTVAAPPNALERGGANVLAAGQHGAEEAKKLIPLTPEEEGRTSVVVAKTAASLLTFLAAAGPAGIPGMVAYGGVESYGKTYEEAKKAGASDEDATVAAAISGVVQGGLNAVPAHKALAVADQIPKMFKGEFIKTLTEMAKSGGTLLGFTQVSQLADNYIAKQTFEPTRKPTEGLGENMGATFAVGALLPVVPAVAARAMRGRTPAEVAKPVMEAKTTDEAIAAAQNTVAEGTPVDISEITRNAEYGTTTEQNQARLLKLFGGMNEGTVEQAGEGYHYRTEIDDQDQTVPLKVWDPAKPLAEGETQTGTISPDLAAAQRKHYDNLGVKVVYFENDARIPFDGAVDPAQPDTIFLSNDPQRNAAQVGAHEVTHLLESTKLPDGTNLGDLLHDQVRKGLTPEGRAYAEQLFGGTAPKREAFGPGVEGDSAHGDAVVRHIVTELGADIGAEAPKFQTFAPRVVEAIEQRYGAEAAKGVLQKLIAGFKNALDTMRNFFSRADEHPEYGQAPTVSQHWVTNLADIHDTLAKMYAVRFGERVERENAALTGMREKVQRDRFLTNFEQPASEIAPPAAPEGFAAQRPAEEPAKAPAEAAIPPEAPRPPGPMSDPAAYAEAASRAATLRRWLGELDAERRSTAPASPQAPLLRQTEAAILAKVNGVEARLTGAQRERLAAVRSQIDALHNPTEPSADMVKVRQALEAEQQRMADAAAAPRIDSETVSRENVAHAKARTVQESPPRDVHRMPSGTENAATTVVQGVPRGLHAPVAENPPADRRGSGKGASSSEREVRPEIGADSGRAVPEVRGEAGREAPSGLQPAAVGDVVVPSAPSGTARTGESGPASGFQAKVRVERERLWAEEMPGYTREGGRLKSGLASASAENERMVTEAARDKVMREEIGEDAVMDAIERGLTDDQIFAIARFYRPEEGKTPQESFREAVDRYAALEHEQALREEAAGIFDPDYDALKVSNPDLDGMDRAYRLMEEANARERAASEAPFESGEAHGNGRADSPEVPERSGGEEAGGQSGGRGAVPGEEVGPSNTLGRTASWVIKNKATGEILFETFDRAKVDALNTEKYEAVPILKHLQDINGTKFSPRETEPRGPALLDTREATADELAARQRRTDKELAEAQMRGRKGGKTGQEAADDLPLFGGDRQKTLFSPRQTETPEFKEWFRSSKVVDAEGKPQVMYHGMKGELEGGGFDPERIGDTWRADERGFFFTSDPKIASQYASGDTIGLSNAEPGAAVVPAYLSLKKPLVIDEAFLRSEGMHDTLGKTEDVISFWDNYQGLIHEWVDERKSDGVILIDASGQGEPVKLAVAFKPTQIKSAIGNGGAFDPANPDIRMSPRVTDYHANPDRQYTPEQEKFNERQRATEAPTWGAWWDKIADRPVTKLAVATVDRYAGIKARDPEGYVGARIANSSEGAKAVWLTEGTLALNGRAYDLKDRMGGARALLTPLKKEVHDFFFWVASHRAGELATEDREHRFTPEDIAAGKTLNQGTLAFDYELSNGKTTRSREAAYMDSLAKLNTLNQNILDLSVKGGLLTRDVADVLMKNQFYVPFFRERADGTAEFVGPQGGMAKQTFGKKLTGGTEKLNSDLVQNWVDNASHIIDAVAKNRAAGQALEAGVKDGIATKLTEQQYNHLSDKQAKAESTWVMEDGTKQYYHVEDPMLFKAVGTLAALADPFYALSAARVVRRVLQVGVTHNPVFAARNLARDSLQALAVTPQSANVFNTIATGMRDSDTLGSLNNLARSVAGRELATSNLSEDAVRLLAGGGMMRIASLSDTGVSKVKVGSLLDTPEKMDGFLNHVSQAMHQYSESVGKGEEYNRIALYKNLREQGVPHDIASFSAQDLTDFSLGGANVIVRYIAATVPFTNSRAQGLYKVGRALSGSDARMFNALGVSQAAPSAKSAAAVTLLRTAGTLAGLTVATMALDALYSNDPEYQQRSEYDRSNYWYFRVGEERFRIPMPFEVGALSRIAADTALAFFDKRMTVNRWASNTWASMQNNLGFGYIPQIVSPVIDVAWTGKSGTGQAIEPRGMENLRPDERYTVNNTMAARGASSAINGLLRALPGQGTVQGPSPMQLDYLTKAYGGWLGSAVLGTADTAIRSFTSEPTRPAGDTWATVTQGLVETSPRMASRYVDALYTQSVAVEQAFATYKDILQRGHGTEAQKFFKDNQELIQKHGLVSSVMRTEGQLNKQIRLIINNPDPRVTAEQKRIQIMQLQAIKSRAAEQVFGAH